MEISQAGLDSIKKHEGLRLRAYRDAVGIWTIGYGHTGPEVQPGMEITEAEAESILREDVMQAESCIEEHVAVDLTQGQFDALCSFIFNLGCGAFERSTLLRLLNEGDYAGAAQQFGRWVNAGGKPLPGLVKRRGDELAMFSDYGDGTLA